MFNQDGSFSYSPDASYNGTDSFTFKANDGTDSGNSHGRHHVTSERRSVAGDGSVETAEDTSAGSPAAATGVDGDT